MQENVLQNQSIMAAQAMSLKEKKEGHNLQEKRLTMTTNFIEQNQRLSNMTKLCVWFVKSQVVTYKVAFKETRKTMLSVRQKLSDNTFLYDLTQLLMLMMLSPTMPYIIIYAGKRQKHWLNQSQNLWKTMPKGWQIFFLIKIHSMQGWKITTRPGVARKRNIKRLKHTENPFTKTLQLTVEHNRNKYISES